MESKASELGYKIKIPNTSVDDQRKQGYINASKRFDIQRHILNFDQKKFPHEKLKQLIQKEKIDAILAADELSAIQIMKSILKSGFKIPEDVSIIGFTNGIMGENFLPSLSTVDQHEEVQRTLAKETMISRIQGDFQKNLFITRWKLQLCTEILQKINSLSKISIDTNNNNYNRNSYWLYKPPRSDIHLFGMLLFISYFPWPYFSNYQHYGNI